MYIITLLFVEHFDSVYFDNICIHKYIYIYIYIYQFIPLHSCDDIYI